MRCQDCQDLLQREADGEELLARAALQHLRGCPPCRAFRTGLARLVEVARLNRPATPSSDFSERLFAAVLADAPARPETPPIRMPWVAFLALAASVLVGLTLYSWLATAPTFVPAPGPEVVEVPSPRNLRESVREAGTALTALTSRTADEVVEHTRHLIPSAPTLPTLDPLNPLSEPPSRSLAQTGSVVAEGFQPMTNSARRAFDLFLRDIPMPETNPGL